MQPVQEASGRMLLAPLLGSRLQGGDHGDLWAVTRAEGRPYLPVCGAHRARGHTPVLETHSESAAAAVHPPVCSPRLLKGECPLVPSAIPSPATAQPPILNVVGKASWAGELWTFPQLTGMHLGSCLSSSSWLLEVHPSCCIPTAQWRAALAKE